MLIAGLTDYVKRRQAEVGVRITQRTADKYERLLRYLKQYLAQRGKAEDIPVERMNYEFLDGFNLFLQTAHRCRHNGAVAVMDCLRNFVLYCLRNEWITKNPFRYYSPEMGIYISSDPIGLAGGFNTYAYVKDTNTWVDVLGLSGELVYQLIRDNKVVYYGITSRTALERMAEHGKTKVFDNMEILADGLTHDQARSIEGALIRQRLKERADDWSDFDSIKARLDKSGLDNRNRGRIKERWTSENPLDDLRDKIYKKPKKVKVGCKS